MTQFFPSKREQDMDIIRGDSDGKEADKEFLSCLVMNEHEFICPMGDETLYVYDEAKKCYSDVIAESIVKGCYKELVGKKATTHGAKEVIAYLKTKCFILREKINPLGQDLNLLNGILDLSDLANPKLNEHSPKTKYFSYCVPIEFRPEADCPAFKKFLGEVCEPNDEKTIQEFFGFCLQGGYKQQVAVMLIGEGANGKSTMLNILRAFLGAKNVTNIPLQNLCDQRFSVAQLYGKKLNYFADLPDKALSATGMFKALTGGDPIPAEKKFKDGFEFLNEAKLAYSCNKLPKVKDDSDAFFRRWIILIFPNQFTNGKEDKNLLGKLTTPEELSGILTWGLEGLKRLEEQGHFTGSKSTELMREEYTRLANPLLAFIQECVKQDSAGFIPKKEFYSAYCAYCRENHLPPISDNTVGKELPMHLSVDGNQRKTVEGRQVPVWVGITPSEVSEDSGVSSYFNIFGENKNKVRENPTNLTNPTDSTLADFEGLEKEAQSNLLSNASLQSLQDHPNQSLQDQPPNKGYADMLLGIVKRYSGEPLPENVQNTIKSSYAEVWVQLLSQGVIEDLGGGRFRVI